MSSDSTTRRQLLRYSGAAIAGTTITVSTASADDGAAGVLSANFEGSFEPISFGRGLGTSATLPVGAPQDLTTLVERCRNEFNANSDAWIDYGNWLLEERGADALGGGEVAVDFALSRRRWPTRSTRESTTIRIDYDDEADEFTDLQWLSGEPDDPEFELLLRNRAVENAGNELQEFRTEWIGEGVDDHEIPSDEYINELAGKYWSLLSLGSDERSALEVLLGEVDV